MMFTWFKALNLKHYVFSAVAVAAVAFKFEAMHAEKLVIYS
jgi:hypothetical protein